MARTSSVVFGLCAGLAFTPAAMAQDWPTRPITLVVPIAAGSSPDIAARILSPRLSELLGQPIIIENVSGAGGMAGGSRVARAAPDGYQFLLGSTGPNAISQTLFKAPLFNTATDFAPVILIVETPLVLVVRKDLPVNSLQEFMAYVEANDRKMQYSSAGAGTVNHLACAMLNTAMGAKVTHIPYRGGGQAIQDLISGQVDYQCPLAALALPLIEANQVKPIAILTKKRSPILPNLPTAHEQGIADFDASSWFAFFLPKGTAPAIVQKLHDATAVALDTPAVRDHLGKIGAETVSAERRSSEYLRNFVKSEIGKWAAAIRSTDLGQN